LSTHLTPRHWVRNQRGTKGTQRSTGRIIKSLRNSLDSTCFGLPHLSSFSNFHMKDLIILVSIYNVISNCRYNRKEFEFEIHDEIGSVDNAVQNKLTDIQKF